MGQAAPGARHGRNCRLVTQRVRPGKMESGYSSARGRLAPIAMPIASCGLKLDDEAVRVAVGLRIGANLCEPHTCVCGQRVTAQGHHGFSCIRGFGRQARHGVINDVIYRALTKAGYHTVKEPPGLVRSDGKRPDGLTLIPWRAGRSLALDATVADTLAASYIANTSTTAGAAAEAAATRKQAKYQELSNTHVFTPSITQAWTSSSTWRVT